MGKDLKNYRRNYIKGELLESNVPKDPIEIFKNWFEEIEVVKDGSEANAMTLSTIGTDGFPRSRVVLLKEFGEEGLIFFTNYNSSKGISLQKNPNCCISFFWPSLERQVIIKGIAEKYSEKKSEEYFRSRPRGSQLGAWASSQSSEIASREILEKCLRELEVRFLDKEIPKPDYWGGFLVKPLSFEFWQGRENRLHDRLLLSKNQDDWEMKRLAP